MQRRKFLAGAGAVIASAIAVRPSLADIGDRQSTFGALRVRLRNGRFQMIDGFSVQDASRALGMRWTHGLPIYNEDRVDLSPLGLGHLFRTPFRIRWQQAQPLGAVDLVGSRLIARVDHAERLADDRATIAAGDYSWDLPLGLAIMPATAGQGHRIGALRIAADGRILVLLEAQPAFLPTDGAFRMGR